MELNVTKAAARETIRKLLATHQQTVQRIVNGEQFFKGGENITSKLHDRVLFEIKQCQMVDDALDYMTAGNIRKAAALCEQIKEFIA